MAAFDHRQAGTDEHRWAIDVRLQQAPRIDVPGLGEHLLLLSAHPDDETLGAGGLVALATERGASIEIIVASDGEASHPLSPTHSKADLAGRRRAEMRAAVRLLNIDCALTFLGLPDGNLGEHSDRLVQCLRTRITARTTVVSPWRSDGHPDHAAVANAARAAVSDTGRPHWQYPVWWWHWATPASTEIPWQHVRSVPLDAAAGRAKTQAIDCFHSQHRGLSGADGDEPVLAKSFLEHFQRPFETFIVEPIPAASCPSFFDELYRLADDPWGLSDRFYEQRKRELLLACLPYPRFRRAFEPGCATGLLTEELADRVDEVLAWDIAERAVGLAARRLRSKSNVVVERGNIATHWPVGPFDLVVLSEVGYYCCDLNALARSVQVSLASTAVVVACHWRHPASDHAHSAAEVHLAVGSTLNSLVSHREEDFLLDVWATDPGSVALLTGILG